MAVLSAVLGAFAQAAFAADASVIVVRADAPQLDAQTVQNIARYFREHELSPAAIALLPKQTPDQVITALCGSVNPDYYAAFQHANHDQTIPHATALGDNGVKLIWPACLRLAPLPSDPKNPQNPGTDPFQALVGSTSDDVGGRTGGLGMFTWLNSDTPFVAIPVELQPKGITMDAAVQILQAHSEGIIFSPPTSKLLGHIVENANPARTNPQDDAVKACPATSVSPFDADVVSSAYGTSVTERASNSATGGVANLIVIDNGFLGADKDTPSAFSGPFPKKLFGGWGDQPTNVGPEAFDGTVEIWPIDYQNNDFLLVNAPTDIQAHGTHVAGLSVGGPDFSAAFTHLFLSDANQASPFRLTIVNLGKGEKYFIERSQDQLDTLIKRTPSGKADLKSARIVNLSLAYDGDQAAGVLQGLFYEFPDTLFVVAAGNDSSEVSANDIYPAALGNKANVITVAASDLRGQLSWFSNYGSKAVDIAAPGCGLMSWYDANQKGAMTGTSQAAPLVSFAASLLKTLDGSLSPWQIKARVMSTGDLLGGGDARWNVVSGSQLNVPEALLLFDDILEVKLDPPVPGAPAPTEIWLGNVTKHWGIRCVGDDSLPQGRSWGDIWALKSVGEDHRLFFGRKTDDFYAPCVAELVGVKGTVTPFIEFQRRAKLGPTGVVPDVSPNPVHVDIDKITKLVPQGPNADTP